MNSTLMHLITGLFLSLFAASGYAADSQLDMSLPSSFYTNQNPKFSMLAVNDVVMIADKSDAKSPVPAFEPKLFSGSNIHEFLGISTVALAGLTFATHIHTNGFGSRDVNGTHGSLGKATGIMALATVASGLITHWDDFSLEDGWTDPDNLHVFLAASGAALMAYAIANSATQTTGRVDHSGMAELGALGMVAAIKLTW